MLPHPPADCHPHAVRPDLRKSAAAEPATPSIHKACLFLYALFSPSGRKLRRIYCSLGAYLHQSTRHRRFLFCAIPHPFAKSANERGTEVMWRQRTAQLWYGDDVPTSGRSAPGPPPGPFPRGEQAHEVPSRAFGRRFEPEPDGRLYAGPGGIGPRRSAGAASISSRNARGRAHCPRIESIHLRAAPRRCRRREGRGRGPLVRRAASSCVD